MRPFAILLLATAALAHLSHERLAGIELPEPKNLRETLPSPEATKLLSLGYRTLAADYYWLRAISQLGDKRMYTAGDPNVRQLLERALALDPRFASAYVLAGGEMSLRSSNPKATVEILERGSRYCPDDWRIPFILGFTYFYYLEDFRRATEALATCARIPNAPPTAAHLAARIAAESGNPQIAIVLIDTLLPEVEDPELRASYVRERELLQMELEIGWLYEAVAHYTATQGRPPRDLTELVTAGLISYVPLDPLGGEYVLDEEGKVTTTSDSERLRTSQGLRRRNKP